MSRIGKLTAVLACLACATVAVAAEAEVESTPLKKVAGKSVWRNCEVADDTVKVKLDMGTKRVNWNNARWAVMDIAEPVDLSKFDGLVLEIATDAPRTDAWVDVAVMENDGSWYYVRDAVPLSTKNRTEKVDFDDMASAEFIFNELGTAAGHSGNFDENFHLDLDSVARVAVGVVNPHGVGTVAFDVKRIGLASWKPEPSKDPIPVTVTGRTLSVNGTEDIPVGLFGFHYVGGDMAAAKPIRPGSMRPHRAMGFGGTMFKAPQPENHVDITVNCQYDRRGQLPQAKSGDWRPKARAAGRKLAEQTKPYGDSAAIEWWNEPYLELGRRLPGSLNAEKPDDVKAGDPVKLKYGRTLKSMVWAEQTDPTSGETKLVPKDPTRFTYWAGRQIGIFYIETFNEFAAEAKKHNPDLQLVAGMGFRWNEDDWAAWDILYKPIVDECIKHMDGVNEHHYQGNTEAIPASYEVINAYSVVKHGKKLDCYNTETNDLWDAPARGRPGAEEQKGVFKSRKRAVYNMRDIMGVLVETPDKARARAIHAFWGGKGDAKEPWGRMGIDKGEYMCLKMLADLRGRIVEVASPDKDLWVVSSIDPVTHSLVTVMFNDADTTKQYKLDIKAPMGTEFVGAEQTELIHADTGLVQLMPAETEAAGKGYERTGYLGPHFASRTALKLKGKPPAKPEVLREQTFCGAPTEDRDPILYDLKPGEEVTLPLAGQPKADSAQRAWIRIVVERLGRGEGTVTIGNMTYELPAAYTPFNTPMIRDIEIDPALLSADATLTFKAAGKEAGDGFLLCMASVVVERR